MPSSPLTSADDIDRYLNYTVQDNSRQSLVAVEFTKSATSLVDEFEFVTCHSFGESYENLKNLCDTEMKHLAFNAKGYCFDQLALLNLAQQEFPLQEYRKTAINEQNSEVPLDLTTLELVGLSDLSPECGSIGFRLTDLTQASLVQITDEGLVSVQLIKDELLIGKHDITFDIFLKDIDGEAVWKVQLDFILSVEVFASDQELA